MRIEKLLLIIFYLFVVEPQSFAQQIDTTRILQQADSLLQMYNMKIPEKYLDEVALKQIKANEVQMVYFESPDFLLDTTFENYSLQYQYRIGSFSGFEFSMLLSNDPKSDSVAVYFSESQFHFLSRIKDKEQVFDGLTKKRIVDKIESNGEIRVDSIKNESSTLLTGWDTLAGNTYFTISFQTIEGGRGSEEMYAFHHSFLTPIDALLDAPYHTPIIAIESADPILCHVKNSGYGIARKHRIYIDVNTFFLMYDGFPSFRFYVSCGGL